MLGERDYILMWAQAVKKSLALCVPREGIYYVKYLTNLISVIFLLRDLISTRRYNAPVDNYEVYGHLTV